MSAGYTLTETLAALLVLGLGMGGFALGAQVIGGQQLAIGGLVADLQDSRAARVRLEQALADGAPFSARDPDKLVGEAAYLRFACGAAGVCEARLAGDRFQMVSGGLSSDYRLPEAAPGRFVYAGADGWAGGSWPPAGSGGALRSVSVVQPGTKGELVVFSARVWPEQPHACAYDPVSGDCR